MAIDFYITQLAFVRRSVILEKSVGLNVEKKMDIATGVTGMDFAVEKDV